MMTRLRERARAHVRDTATSGSWCTVCGQP